MSESKYIGAGKEKFEYWKYGESMGRYYN